MKTIQRDQGTKEQRKEVGKAPETSPLPPCSSAPLPPCSSAPLLLLLIAAALRLIGLNNVSPPGLAHDEVANWLIDRSILAGEHAIYFTRAYGHEAGFHYVQAAFVALIGDNALALRLPAAFFGLLGVAISYALARRLFGRDVALLAAALLATLFWPVFYSRLALRAISLPFFAGLSAYFFWKGINSTQRHKGTKTQRKEEEKVKSFSPLPLRPFAPLLPRSPAPLLPFLLAGLFAGLAMHTYMAARALPIFYGLYFVYLTLFHRDVWRRHGWGLAGFTAVFALVAAPLLIFLLQNPGAEFRIAEVSAPLDALRGGDLRPILANAWRIMIGFGFAGDPLWRQNVAFAPVFEPVGALFFYAGVFISLWRWRDRRYGFVLLWLAVSAVPSLVTINAPSTIRMINALPLVTVFPAIVIHNLFNLSTVFPRLSTDFAKIHLLFLLTIVGVYGTRTAVFTFRDWPAGGDVPFVWQAAFTEIAAALDVDRQIGAAAVAGWSPETMDPNTMILLLRRDDVQTSHFHPEAGTLILPAGDDALHLFRPAILPLDPVWEARLAVWGAPARENGRFIHYTIPSPAIRPAQETAVSFGDELLWLGYDLDCTAGACELITYWRVLAPPGGARRLFVHALDAGGALLAEAYRLDAPDPQGLWFAHWHPGDTILQRVEIAYPETAVALRLGLFDPYTCTPGPCQNLRTDGGELFVQITGGK